MAELWTPVLLTPDDIDAPHSVFGFPRDAIWSAAEAKDGARNGVFEAAEIMLREAAVVVQHIDVSDQGHEVHIDPGRPYVQPGNIIGFNDHAGGSESSYKLLVNCYFDGEEPSQYVLYSPPEEDGSPSNLTFRRSDFTFLDWAAEGTRERHIPNNLKTYSIAHQLGRNFYEFYILGDHTVPTQFAEVLKAAGFSFEPEPFETFGDEIRRLHDLEYAYEKDTIEPRALRWPKDQFAGQIALLRELEEAPEPLA